MGIVKDFFISKGFNFKDNLKLKKDFFGTNEILSKKIENHIFYYECPPQTKTSFYLITETLTDSEFKEIRKYIWNEDKADLIFSIQETKKTDLFENDFKLNLYYAKISPITEISLYKIDTFSGSIADKNKLDSINKWEFDSGAFWLNYKGFIDKIKKSKSIDKELVFTLENLKKDLLIETKDENIVQALIDRTLYIKYLEDNHIINSFFYKHYFDNNSLTYKDLLKNQDTLNVNYLFKIINEIFNNYLFVTPEISVDYLNEKVFDLIYHSISGTKPNGQLSLFDFQFSIIPVEFISYIYEIFLKEDQKKSGIFYTPKKLAQLIIDDVIPKQKIGKVLDPSCGSGMFLIVAFQKLIENNPCTSENVSEKIEHRIKLLSENIFGIEKKSIAQRFTIFSLSLQIFRDLDAEEIKEFISNELKNENEVRLFKKYSFFENIICSNSLDTKNAPFADKKFDYIVGNPPFFEIKSIDEEVSFLNDYVIKYFDKELKAKEIVGKHQISQCFLIKIKDWSNENTRFGFVSNNSNFYNDNSKKFQKYFYESYGIEKIYELSKVKNILFENAKESVNALVFNNIRNKNIIEYYPVEMGLFSEKPFELLIIQEDKIVEINQEKIITDEIRLRDFLIGNEFDKLLLKKISNNKTLNDFIQFNTKEESYIHRGFEIWGEDARKKEYKISENDWKKLDDESKDKLLTSFLKKYFSDEKKLDYTTCYVKPKNLNPFYISSDLRYINNLGNFHRPRTEDIYIGEKIILSRLGDSLRAVYSNEKIYFDFSIYVLKLSNPELYYLITAILNSKLSDYYINQYLRKRVLDSFPRIGIDDIKMIPIPTELDEVLVSEISNLSKNLSNQKIKYNDKIENKINELIFDLYKINFIDRLRINDFFTKKAKITKSELKRYEQTLIESLEVYFENAITIRHYHYTEFKLIVFGIYFNSENQKPSTEKVSKFIINEIFEQNPSENFLASQEKILGKDCVYILRKDENINWTETKAFEDGQEILNRM